VYPVAADVLALVLAKARFQCVIKGLAYALQGLSRVLEWGRGRRKGGISVRKTATAIKQREKGTQILRLSNA
jgi:hypothetical protein